MQSNNNIPKAATDVITMAYQALSGAEAHGAAVKLRHNTAERLSADILKLAGNPAAPGTPGRQALLDAQLRAMRETYAALQVARKAARTFCHQGMGILRQKLGQRWNGDWLAAGFSGPSLAVPATPLALLLQFRKYFVANPGMECPEFGLTAADAQNHCELVQAAILARETARGARWSVKAARDAAFRQLRKRLSNLRAELALLLSPADDRWYAFGFRRPADGRQPEPVEKVETAPVSEGAVLVNWTPSPRATKYRVTWRRSEESPEEAKDHGFFTKPQCLLTGLPRGEDIIVAICARNATGETPPTEIWTKLSNPPPLVPQ